MTNHDIYIATCLWYILPGLAMVICNNDPPDSSEDNVAMTFYLIAYWVLSPLIVLLWLVRYAPSALPRLFRAFGSVIKDIYIRDND